MKFEPVSSFPLCFTEKESDDVSAWIHAESGGAWRFQVTGTSTMLPLPVVNVTVYLYELGEIVVEASILTLTTWLPLLSKFPLRGEISSDVLPSSDTVKLSFAPQWVRVTFRAAGRSFPHSLVKVSDGGLTLHSCEVDRETVSDTLTLLMSVASPLVVILNGIVAVYVPASRPLLSTVIETSALSFACKYPLDGLTLSQFLPSSVSTELFQCPASPQLVILTVRDLGPLS
jgi:hypothetical protein